MPNRPKPGSSRGNGSGLRGVLELLGGIFGGVEANPDISQVGPTPDGIPLGSKPFKAKTIFDRNEASRLNAGYAADQFGADNQVARILAQRRAMVPINVDEASQLGAITNKNELDLFKDKDAFTSGNFKRDSANKIEEARVLAAIQNMVAQKLNPTKGMEQEFNASANPMILNALKSKALEDASASQFGITRNNQGNTILQDIFPQTQATARFNANTTEKTAGLIDQDAARAFERKTLAEGLKNQQSEVENARLRYMSPNEQGAFDPMTGKQLVTPKSLDPSIPQIYKKASNLNTGHIVEDENGNMVNLKTGKIYKVQ